MLDLFSGLEGWATIFREQGWNTRTLDIDARFHPDIKADILSISSLTTLENTGPFHVITASPPCEAFSTGSISKHWGGGLQAYIPITSKARIALQIVQHTFQLIDEYALTHPDMLYVIENPRGVMRKITPRPPTDTTWYCQWGEKRAKPTDLWTNMSIFSDWPKCHNGGTDHDAQSRYYWKRLQLGQTGGTQGLPNTEMRALIPRKLAQAFEEYARKHLPSLSDR